MSLNFPVDSVNHSRFILGEQLEHLTPPHAFDSENRATMTRERLRNFVGDGRGSQAEGITHVHVRILGIEIILLTSLKIQQGLKLRVCFSKVDKSWVGDFNWALPLWQFSPFFTTTIVLSKVFCLSNLS